MKLESILQYLDAYLRVSEHADYPNAVNGLQVGGPDAVQRICAAVDASEAAISDAAGKEADLLIVHHGMFWDGLKPATDRRYRKLRCLIEARMGLYSVHLPLDSHSEVGNCALLMRRLGVDLEGRFGHYEDAEIGWWGEIDEDRDEFRDRVEVAVEGPVRLVAGGPQTVRRVGVVTGGGGSLLAEAADAGLDAFVTGEGSHHTFVDAHELGVNVYLAGHYATETFGVRALAGHLAARFGLEWEFLDHPSGL